MTSLRVAAGQAVSIAGDLRANAATAARLVEQAGAAGVDLLVLPEAFLTGYGEEIFAGPLPSMGTVLAALAPVVAAARAHDLTVVVNTALDESGRRTLTSIVLGDGEPVCYDKQHLSDYEQMYFVPGDDGVSIRIGEAEAALAVCYDSSFPEHARRAAVDGAELYLVSAAFFPGSAHRRDLYAASRALDNGMFVVFSGLTGPCGPERFIGGSAVYDPEGRVLARLDDEEGLAVADLDLALVARTRAAHPMLAERRSDLGARRRVLGLPPR